jgi:serine protease Do
MSKENKGISKLLFYIFFLIALTGGLLAYASWNSMQDLAQRLESLPHQSDPLEEFGQEVKIVSEENNLIEMIEEASPAVVSIIATAEVPTFETYFHDPFFSLPEELMPFFNFEIPEQRQNSTETIQIGAGTGFIVSADGYIITNKHVVEDETAEYTVFLNNKEDKGEKVPVQVLARDPNNDLAVLKIEKDNLPYLEFGNSDNLKVGQTAITIGYALGEFDNTVSRGVISGLARSIIAGSGYRASEQLNDLIQTDAAINPGNSGGPMLNLNGQVIGINVAMANAENIGFAIPASFAKQSFEEVKETGTIKKQEIAFLGVRYLIINKNIQEKNNLPYDYGALITRGENLADLAVMPGSPADKAGLVENDIILELENKKITERQPLAQLISKYKPEEEINIKFYHKGEEKEVKIKLGKID